MLFFGHDARAQPTKDSHCSLHAEMQRPPRSWKQPCGSPSVTRLQVVADYVKPMDFEDHAACQIMKGDIVSQAQLCPEDYVERVSNSLVKALNIL